MIIYLNFVFSLKIDAINDILRAIVQKINIFGYEKSFGNAG